MMKKLISFFVMAAGMSLLFPNPLFATTRGYLIFNMPGEATLPQNFRILNYPCEDLSTCNVLGLNELKASGSGQFSEKSFNELVRVLPLQSEQLIVCNLREEIQAGMINGLPPITLEDELHRHGFFNRTIEEVEMDEYGNYRLVLESGDLLIERNGQLAELFEWIDSRAMTEGEFVADMGHVYVRFYTRDGHRLNDRVVDNFVLFIHDLSPDQWIHFHCREGKQRTALFLLLMDIIKNSHQVSLEDILARHQLISGIDLEDFYSKERASEEDEQEDFNFLSEFYVYCQQVPDFRIPWSKWIQQRLLVLGSSCPSDSSFQRSHILTNKRAFHERAISDAVSEISEVLYSFKCGYEVKAEVKYEGGSWRDGGRWNKGNRMGTM